jgi:uncharacterized repeat protein (TIGR03803 family)
MRKNTSYLLFVFAVLALATMSSATETVLHNFCAVQGCGDGANPVSDLVQDGNGNLWGTTRDRGRNGFGTVFELTKSSGFKVLGQVYSFRGGTGDGATPEAGLVFDPVSGNLYGTTSAGGSGPCSGGCGTIFALHPGNQVDQILHIFGATGDGAIPMAILLADASGNLYGTTSAGGSGNCNGGCGTVFVLNAHSLVYSVLYRFAGSSDGANPVAGLVFDGQGNLRGTAKNGGTRNFGSVFELLAPTFATLGQVYSFRGIPDGANPAAALVFDPTVGAKGALYGTTSAGGLSRLSCSAGCGTVFALLPQTSGGFVYRHFYNFTGSGPGTSGAAPIARLALETTDVAHAGHLYGTASLGGISAGVCAPGGCGTAFEICPPVRACGWIESTLFYFNGAKGRNPSAGMLLLPPPGGSIDRGPIFPPTGKGACTGSCVGTAVNGGQNGSGVVYQLGP